MLRLAKRNKDKLGYSKKSHNLVAPEISIEISYAIKSVYNIKNITANKLLNFNLALKFSLNGGRNG